MNDESLTQLAKKLEKYVVTSPAAKKFNTLSVGPRKAMMNLSDCTYNLRINIERYYGSDDTAEQSMYLEEAIILVDNAGEAVLEASNHDLLGAADVAQLGALVELVKDRLK